MRLLFLASCFFSIALAASAQPGKYAGSRKTLIGKEYTDIQKFPDLKGWQYMEGAIVNSNPNEDPEMHAVNVVSIGTTYLIIFSISEDANHEVFKITDVVQVAGVAKGWTIRSASCRRNKQNDAYIIVWGKETTDEFMKLIKKAWRINPDKRKIEIIPVKNVECENIGC